MMGKKKTQGQRAGAGRDDGASARKKRIHKHNGIEQPVAQGRLSGRARRKVLAQETLDILESRQYTLHGSSSSKQVVQEGEENHGTKEETVVDIAAELTRAIDGTIVFLDEAAFKDKPQHPNHRLGAPVLTDVRAQAGETQATPTRSEKHEECEECEECEEEGTPRQHDHVVTEVTDETTVAALERLHQQFPQARIGVLNFASARNPGGGFRGGSLAQEESLALASGLFACQTSDICSAYYSYHNKIKDTRYTHTMLYSPQVPFFRHDDGELCPMHFADVITCPAVNAGVCLKRGIKPAEVEALMNERIHRVLSTFAAMGNDVLVLGAFGCGVFRNSPELVAAIFHRLLSGPFASAFAHVAFAIPGAGGSKNGAPFVRLLHGSARRNDIRDDDDDDE